MPRFKHLLPTVILGISLFPLCGESAFLPVCQRTPAVKKFLEQAVRKTCETITETDLLAVKRVAVGNEEIRTFNPDDFSGLTSLEILNIRSNPYTELPEGLLKDLIHLKTLVIISTELRHYPDDFLAYNPEIENLHVFRNNVRSISESIFLRLQNASHLKVIDFDLTLQDAERERLRRLFPEGGTVELSFI